jgi:prostamide/prostaglandin F2alpha synthase
MQLHRARSKFDEAGGQLVLIGQATPRQAAHFRRRQGIQLPVLADKDRVSYEAAGAKSAGVLDLWNPKVVAKGAVTGLREKTVQGRTIGDANQLGGALVVNTEGDVTWSHMSTDAGDNAAPEEILAALKAAAT